jgi:hypothetical protein
MFKSQRMELAFLGFGYLEIWNWDLFGIWNLVIGI